MGEESVAENRSGHRNNGWRARVLQKVIDSRKRESGFATDRSAGLADTVPEKVEAAFAFSQEYGAHDR